MLIGKANATPNIDTNPVVFLLDVDNTLLDNDRFSADLDAHLTQALGAQGRIRYRELYESLRVERGYADYLAPLQELRGDFETDPDLFQLSSFMLDYPFADRKYPDALETLSHLSTIGLPVILSDGDVIFQPRKIQRSGLWDAVQGRVLVYLHKQDSLDAMQAAYTARHYVAIDDKPHLLAAIKTKLGARATTIFVRQGHYAAAGGVDAVQPQPDLTFEHIGDLRTLDVERLRPAAIAVATFPEIP